MSSADAGEFASEFVGERVMITNFTSLLSRLDTSTQRNTTPTDIDTNDFPLKIVPLLFILFYLKWYILFFVLFFLPFFFLRICSQTFQEMCIIFNIIKATCSTECK